MRGSLAFLATALASLAPAIAAACPQCADKADNNIASTIALGAFVFFPFAVVGVVAKLVKRFETRDRRLPE